MTQLSSGEILSQFIFKNTNCIPKMYRYQITKQENKLVKKEEICMHSSSKYRPNYINKSLVISRQDRNIRGRTISGGSAYRSEVRGKEKEKKKRKRKEGRTRYSGSQESSDKCISISPYWRGLGRR